MALNDIKINVHDFPACIYKTGPVKQNSAVFQINQQVVHISVIVRNTAVSSTKTCFIVTRDGQDELKHIMTLMSHNDNHIILVCCVTMPHAVPKPSERGPLYPFSAGLPYRIQDLTDII